MKLRIKNLTLLGDRSERFNRGIAKLTKKLNSHMRLERRNYTLNASGNDMPISVIMDWAKKMGISKSEAHQMIKGTVDVRDTNSYKLARAARKSVGNVLRESLQNSGNLGHAIRLKDSIKDTAGAYKKAASGAGANNLRDLADLLRSQAGTYDRTQDLIEGIGRNKGKFVDELVKSGQGRVTDVTNKLIGRGAAKLRGLIR